MRCPKAQLVLLNFLMRMRADRDHQIYISSTEAVDNETRGLAGLLKRTAQSSGAGTGRPLHQEQPPNQNHGAGPHVQFQPQQHPHTNPRGRHSDRDKESSSRSRSRPPPKQEPSPRIVPSNPSGGVPPLPLVESPMLWGVPERSPFDLPGSALPKDGIQTHIPGTTVDAEPVVLQINKYLSVLVDIIDSKEGHAQDDDREVVSYVLCHLPAQLSNKHFFCGPRTKSEVARLIETMCRAIERDEFSRVARGSGGMLRPWDVNAVAYHTLQVLVSYRTSFDSRRAQDRLINTFVKGLIPHSPTAKPCLDALTLCAFDLTNSLSRHLSTIVVKLAQIMSNTAVAVHILDFLGFIVTKPLLFANFTQDEHKLVFGVVLQYLVVHNRQQPDSHSEERSWALSQHVLVYTYYVLYTLVLALPVGERKSYVPYITKQLLQAQAQSDGANGSASTIDERTEVAFDWLARYTYASTDPKPARSFLRSLVMPRHQPLSDPSNPAASAYRSTSDDFDENSGGETYVFSTSILTIRSTERTGWVDVDIRRPSGRTSFLCRVENVPLAGLGEHDPDLVSESAELMMNRDPEWMKAARFPDIDDNKHTPTPSLATGLEEPSANELDDNLTEAISAPLAAPAARPHSTTGYVWSGSAPSQRRKDVIMHPEFTLLQLSQYPNGFDWSALHASKYQRLGSAIRTLDRMPVIETHMIGVLYVAPGQTKERDILSNEHGSPAYSRFMSGLARLVRVAGQRDIYIGGLDSSDGEFAYAWWDDIGQILYHTATLIPNDDEMDHSRARKKRNLGNSHVKIIWNDSGKPFAFHTIPTAFQFVNIVIEPHSRGTVAAYSDNQHENEYFRVTLQRVEGMPRFDPVGEYKIVCAESLPEYVRQLGLLSDFFSRVWETTQADSQENDIITNWRHRLQRIRRLWKEVKEFREEEQNEGRMRLRRDGEEGRRDFTLFAGGVPPENTVQN
ncbi:hypothetical protein BKA62DRAFT_74273 [Auriculariales sp. MPI-PUGE-AT-0066]|nr:hypothetical protein BKA62DRAFT_74273 [Auriculariales sp. MPI-PUGE-AT-0066]